MTNILPDMATNIFNSLSEIKETIAKLEERATWNKTIIILIFGAIISAIIGGIAWSGMQQFQLGALTEASKNNAAQIDKLVTAIEQQSKELQRISFEAPRHSVAYTTARVASDVSPTRTIVRRGVLSSKTQLPEQSSVFRFPMLLNVNPYDVRHVSVELDTPIPNSSITARLVAGGTFCEIEIWGDDVAALAARLTPGVPATVIVTVSSPVEPYFPSSMPTQDIPVPATANGKRGE